MNSRALSLIGFGMKIIGISLVSVMFLTLIVPSALAGGGASKVQRFRDLKRAIQRVSPLEVVSDTPDPAANATADASKDELYWKGRAEEATYIGDNEAAKIIEALDMAIQLRTEDALFALKSFIEFFPQSIFKDEAAMAIEVLNAPDIDEDVAEKRTAKPAGAAGAAEVETPMEVEDAAPAGEPDAEEDDGAWTLKEEPVPAPGSGVVASEPSSVADEADDDGDWTVIEPSTASEPDEMRFEIDGGDEEGDFDDEGE